MDAVAALVNDNYSFPLATIIIYQVIWTVIVHVCCLSWRLAPWAERSLWRR